MYKFVRPLIFTQDSERMHSLMLWLGEHILGYAPFRPILSSIYEFEDPVLEQKFLGIKFKNPVGVPGGFDKSARMLDFWPALGLGFIEIGSVTAGGGKGNPKPRMWRLPEDLAVVNRMGLNNIGADAMEKKLDARLQSGKICDIPLGVNIAKTHNPDILGEKGIEDYCYSFKKLHRFADYVLINISCPNTAEGKTFEECEAMEALLREIKKIIDAEKIIKPVLVKLSPDISFNDLDQILMVAEQCGISGYVIANCAYGMREGLKTPLSRLERIGRGGLSGEPIRQKTVDLIKHAYKNLKRPCIVGLGGIDSAEDAYQKIKAGASLIQVFNGLIYEGPRLVKNIKIGLVELLKRDGFANISEAVGVEAQ
ncbi:MAG: quinone-dependent dihydroorotate dehydrogenase [Candidatus Doudnabacteria bacterium]|nr:quinone-dependent dihydroorotate dehydrogenase [Candidatus Doudnabacteria bacterium]